MSIVQAKAVDSAGGATTLNNVYPATMNAANFRFALICPRGLIDTTTEVESPGSVGMTKQTTNIDDPDGLGNVVVQCWAPGSFTATTSSLSSFPSSCKAIKYIFEDDEIDPAVGFLGGVVGANGSIAVTTWATATKAFTGDLVVYEMTTTGAGSDVHYAAGAGRAAVAGTNITTGHHGNTTDGDDMFVQRRVIIGGGTIGASGTCDSSSQNSAIYVFRKLAASDILLAQACY